MIQEINEKTGFNHSKRFCIEVKFTDFNSIWLHWKSYRTWRQGLQALRDLQKCNSYGKGYAFRLSHKYYLNASKEYFTVGDYRRETLHAIRKGVVFKEVDGIVFDNYNNAKSWAMKNLSKEAKVFRLLGCDENMLINYKNKSYSTLKERCPMELIEFDY